MNPNGTLLLRERLDWRTLSVLMRRVYFMWVVILFGVALCVTSLVDFTRALASKSWPSSEGRITYSEVQQGAPTVEYVFAVDGLNHSGRNIAFGFFFGMIDSTELVKKYPKGTEVTVRYRAAKPSIAVLEPGLNTGIWMSLLIGIGIVWGGFYGMHNDLGSLDK